MKNQKIAFVGTGRMGANMARNLKDRGYNISAINDSDISTATKLANELGAKYCDSLSAVSYTHLTLPTICSV